MHIAGVRLSFLTVPFILVIALCAGSAVYAICKGIGGQLQRFDWSSRIFDRAACLLPLIYFSVFATLSVTSFLSFHTDGYDLSIFDQVVWNSLRGRLFENTVLEDAHFLLGQRFSPILLAFVPLYAVWSSPIVLLVVQTLGIAIGGIPLYWIARDRVGRAIALVLMIGFYLSPALEYVNLAEFHEIALVIPLFSFATFFLLRDKPVPFSVCLALSLLVKEEVGLAVIMFGAYVFFVQRRRLFGSVLALFGMAWTVLLLQYVLPFLNGSEWGGGYYYFGHGIAAGVGRYDYLGSSLPEIIASILTRPELVLSHIFTERKVEFVLALIVPLGLLPLAGPELALLALPTFATSLLSDYALQTSIQSHYPSSIVPFLSFGAVVGVRRIVQFRNTSLTEIRARKFALAAFVLATCGASYYDLAPGPLARSFRPELYTLDAHTAVGRSMLGLIPPNAIVMAQGEIAPSLSGREFFFGFPALDFCVPEYLIGDKTDYKYKMFERDWLHWLGTGHFDILAEQDGFFVARRKFPNQSIDLLFGDRIRLTRYTTAMTTPKGGEPLCPIVEWETAAAVDVRYVHEAELVDMQGHRVAVGEPRVSTLRDGQAVQQQYIFRLPPTIAKGDYQFILRIHDSYSDRILEARDATGRQVGESPVIATIHVEKNKSSLTASQLVIEQRYYVDMREMRLLGFGDVPDRIAAGERLELGVYWRARGKPRGDYQVAVQLRDADGRVVLEQSSRPATDTYPTTQWSEGEVLLDWHDIELPRGWAGKYTLHVVLRDAGSKEVLGEALVKTIEICDSETSPTEPR